MPSELAVQRAISAMGSLLDGTPVYVPRGAQITNGRGDAFVHIDWTEHQRRQQVGLKAITQLWHLDLLMNLPLDQPVDAGSLTADEKWCLERIPAGAIERDGNWAIRRCKPVISIAAVIGWGPQLQKLLRSVAPFARVAQRMVVLDRIPTNFDEISWEASYDGVGVWLATDNESTELISPEPVRPRYYTPARWKANEHAYRAWLATRNQAPTAAP
ncbi:hypothetical protein [Mycobacteroides abscessus]|uniref:hypothetical protein n=1 Tax=Mycobacteroides abscessus TaxID=36809 RepID=UPI0009CF19D3|nr:hypothetical protein [Mycobacteroides abscessus]SKU61507.1 Uncharacterised protein [Mycobacteroides abscessus subsp. massiliense]